SFYNRWGSLIYETNDQKALWDGRDFSGSLMNDGSYYFIIEYINQIEDSKGSFKGKVMIFK
ncbi:MAG: gliding motility-associated C-terminal domain-containing protein, partial [Flavobacteriales bacterium]|nr:gliding motility-associated C-terminal domain-containing protein [Flavobacteriales bacterium]